MLLLVGGRWRPVEPERDPAALRTEPYKWKGFVPDASPLKALRDRAYRWKWVHRGKEGPNPVASLDDSAHKWHASQPEQSPLDQLPDAKYTWKGEDKKGPNALAV